MGKQVCKIVLQLTFRALYYQVAESVIAHGKVR